MKNVLRFLEAFFLKTPSLIFHPAFKMLPWQILPPLTISKQPLSLTTLVMRGQRVIQLRNSQTPIQYKRAMILHIIYQHIPRQIELFQRFKSRQVSNLSEVYQSVLR